MRKRNTPSESSRASIGGCHSPQPTAEAQNGRRTARPTYSLFVRSNSSFRGVGRPTKPDLAPIGILTAPTPAEGDLGASAKGALQKDGIVELPHLPRPIHD